MVGAVAPAPLRAQSTVELTLAATTDVHGRLRGWDYYANAADPARGLARAATIVDSIRRAAPGRVILVDAGDLLQGNPMTYVAARVDSLEPSPVVAAMNVMRYDAAAVGNHEFNYGLATLDRARAGAEFPFLAANADRLDGGRPFPASVTVTREGVKVAIIGVTNPGAVVWDRDHLRNRVTVRDIVASVTLEVAAAQRAGADLVVVVAHAGLDGDASYDTLDTGVPSENPMARVAREVPGIDVLVVGHSHREVADSTINGVLVIQPRNWATSVATAKVTLIQRAGHWTVTGKRGALVAARGHAEQAAVVRAVERAHKAAIAHSTAVIGRAEGEFRTDSARVRDVPLIDLIQETQLRATGADLSIASAFTLDATIPAGPVSVAQIAQLYPYENTLRALRLSGAQVRAFLEHSARYWLVEADGRGGLRGAPDARIPGYNFDMLAGVEYAIDLARPIGARITGLTYRGRPVADTDSFTVAVNNYRASGGGGYAMLRGAPVVFESSTEIRDLLIEEVRRRGVLRPADIGAVNWSLLPPRPSIRLVTVNDFHGAFVPRPDGNAGNRGGAAELATAIRETLAECAPSCVPLVLHGGDLFQGTPASNLAYGRTLVPVLDALGFTAGALGNHEFDWGQDTLRARMRELRSPILGANVTYADGRDVPWIPDDTLVTVQGVRIGIVGVADPATPRTTMPTQVADLRFADPAPIVNARAAALRARGAQRVILVAHIGGFCTGATCSGEIIDLAKRLEPGRVDAIVSGHTHSAITTVVNGIPIVQARSSGRSLGVIDLPAEGTAGRPVLRTVVSDSLVPDPAVARLVQAAEAAVASRVRAVVAEATEDWPRRGDQYALGNLIADAQRAAGAGDVAVMNNGGIRTDLRAGKVTWGDVFEVQPFANRLVAVTVQGDALRKYLEALVDGRGIRYHVSGVAITYDPTAPSGARLRSVVMNDGRPLDDRRRYRVVMTDFLAAGGDGAAFSRDAEVQELGLIDLDVLVNHLRALRGGKLTPTGAQRAPRIRTVP
ncbi:MAG: 2,3-cyclic-nucleotide 2-phosphodiesterase precursor [Gemmatimonadota bacterium]|jgi:2',3'-cyclic-nucleotide 2'-phosphodiesterase / 3'-nucleotidase / 5'-nucleotidase